MATTAPTDPADEELADAPLYTDAAALPDAPPVAARPKRRIVFWCCVGWLVLVVATSLLANWLPFVHSYRTNHIRERMKPPSGSHWFGTDKLGRDSFSRVVYGARTSIGIAVVSIVLGLTVGGFLGLVAGYYRRKLDRVISSGVDILLAFPALILALAITSFMGHGFWQVVLALSVLSVAPLTRVVRAQTMVYAQREFVLAARGLGAKDSRILFREVLPNVVPAMLTFALTGMAVLIVAEGGLAFLGQSVQVPIPTWGFLINEGREQDTLTKAWWISLIPCACLFATVLSVNLIGDQLAKRFDIKEAGV